MRVDFRASYVSWSRSISMVSVSSLNQVTTSGRLRLHNAGTQPDRDMELFPKWMVVGTTFLRSNSSKSPVVLVLVIPVNHPHFLKIHPQKKNTSFFGKQSTAVEGLFFFRDGEPNDSSVTLRPKSLSSLRFARHVSKVAKCVARASGEIYIVSSK